MIGCLVQLSKLSWVIVEDVMAKARLQILRSIDYKLAIVVKAVDVNAKQTISMLTSGT